MGAWLSRSSLLMMFSAFLGQLPITSLDTVSRYSIVNIINDACKPPCHYVILMVFIFNFRGKMSKIVRKAICVASAGQPLGPYK